MLRRVWAGFVMVALAPVLVALGLVVVGEMCWNEWRDGPEVPGPADDDDPEYAAMAFYVTTPLGELRRKRRWRRRHGVTLTAGQRRREARRFQALRRQRILDAGPREEKDAFEVLKSGL